MTISMADVSLTFDMGSFDMVQEALLDLLANAKAQGFDALQSLSLDIMGESLNQVPEDTGALASTAFIDADDESNITIGYNGMTAINPKTDKFVADYIIQVHEDLSAFHPKGKAKFFEDPIIEAAFNFESTIAEAVAKALLD